MTHPLRLEALRLAEETLSRVLVELGSDAAFLLGRNGSVIGLRGHAALPFHPAAWQRTLASARRGRVVSVTVRGTASPSILTYGITRGVILAVTTTRADFRRRRALREAGADLRSELQALLRRNRRGPPAEGEDPGSGAASWPAVPLPPFIGRH